MAAVLAFRLPSTTRMRSRRSELPLERSMRPVERVGVLRWRVAVLRGSHAWHVRTALSRACQGGIRAQDRDEKAQSKRVLSSLAQRDERSRVTRFLFSCVCVLVVDRGPEAESLAHLSCSRTPEAGASARTGGLGYGVGVVERDSRQGV